MVSGIIKVQKKMGVVVPWKGGNKLFTSPDRNSLEGFARAKKFMKVR